MSTSYSANQFNSSFKPSSLNNWEVPGDGRQRTGCVGRDLSFICDDRGHLSNRSPNSPNSFAQARADATRWPSSPHSPGPGSATMGYKGIITSYLPTSTVYLKNNPDSNEFNYH